MAETFEEYRSRVLGYLGGRDPVSVLQRTPGRLKRLVSTIPPRVLIRKPEPAKWCIAEILAHLADAELAIGWRFRNMLATPGVHLQWWDEHLWSQELNYAERQPRHSLALFEALRAGNLALLQSVPRSRWRSCYGVHEKRGRQTIEEFVLMEAAHDLNHLAQIKRLIAEHP